jgi:hypothetical protein
VVELFAPHAQGEVHFVKDKQKGWQVTEVKEQSDDPIE